MLNTKRLAWRRCPNSQRGTAVFRRSLGATELKLYWDNVFSGTTMTIEHLVLDASSELKEEMFGRENIELAWMRMKQRFPLLATRVDELPGSELVEFVLDETALCSIRPGEVNLVDNQDVTGMTNELLNGPPVLTNEITAKLWIIHQEQKDVPRRYHALITAAPYVTNHISGATLTRELCQGLSSLSKDNSGEGELLAKRLSKSLPVEVLQLSNSLSLSQKRWRSAAAKIINKLRQKKRKGDQTLPVLRPVDLSRPAVTRTMSLRLPVYASRAVASTCRTNCISFGSALPVLSQLALSRVLHRHRNNAEDQRPSANNGEEYDYRLLHPMRYAISQKSTNHEWYEAGSVAEVGFAVGFHDVVLPPMAIPKVLYPENQSYPSQSNIQSLARWLEGPRDVNAFLSDGPIDPGDQCETDGIGDDAQYSKASFRKDGQPSFSSLLSQQLFLARAHMIHKQNSVQLRHPLLHELHDERMLELSQRTRARGLAWRWAKQAGQSEAARILSEAQSTFSEQGGQFVIDGESILDDRDMPFPTDYPLSSPSLHTSQKRLQVVGSETHLRCPPGHIYLGMRTIRGELTLNLCADANVFDPDLVWEWLKEIKVATVHYLVGGNWDNDDGARLPAKL